MQRPNVGHYAVSRAGDEAVRAFVPAPLPPDPPVDLGGTRAFAHQECLAAVARLDGALQHMGDADLLHIAFHLKEAVLSSQIEGTQSTVTDLLMHQAGLVPQAPRNDVEDVVQYLAAYQRGVELLAQGFPLSSWLLREVHGVLLGSGRHTALTPGAYRESQNWIGGTRPGNAAFVPPPALEVSECMRALENYIVAPNDSLPLLVRVALAHAQFETIHPFLDGNGRTGRLLIMLQLMHGGLIGQPFYLSLFLKQRRSEYFDLLSLVRTSGDWEAWIEFFLDGLCATSVSAIDAASRLTSVTRSDRRRIDERGGRRAPSLRTVFDALRNRLVVSIRTASEETGLSQPTVATAIRSLCDLDIAEEITGYARNRLWRYRTVVDILNEGA